MTGWGSGGRELGDELMAPDTHAYDQWLQYQTYDVTELLHTPAGEQVLDLGQNIAGTFHLTLRGSQPRHVHVHLQFSELLQDDNSYRDNLRTAQAAYDFVGTMPEGGT